jgi:hypothetical protein
MNKQVNRLIVFRAAQAYMNRHHRAPSARELEVTTGLAHPTCLSHMRALDGADGLSHRFTFERGFRVGEQMHNRERNVGNRSRDPWTSPVDRLMAS